ncbi:uncharacterized protein ATC70_012819 [Mucor velutinosus]|uniref:NAD(P)-binding domain-containing protein n=1 Tax=Mucor velutinosus TaxID=708070 RepID=A0AAN7D7E9_9FUNG|nr:hypothetical protein ATC70_012819 [Mucor velutinosus]
MKLLIFGGTGLTGQKVIEKAISKNHQVVAYMRSPQKLDPVLASKITVIEGELDDQENIMHALDGVDAVLSTLGPTSAPSKGLPITHGYQTIVTCMERKGIRRIIALGTPSYKDQEYDGTSWIATLAIGSIKWMMHDAYLEMNGIGNALQASHLDWTLARVYFLTNGNEGTVKSGYVGETGFFISRSDLAQFFINELEQNEFVLKAPVIYAA